MRKINLVFVAMFTLIATVANASDNMYGLKGGLTLSTFTGGPEQYEASLTPNGHIGGFAAFSISDKVFFETGLLLSMKGASGEYTLPSDQADPQTGEVLDVVLEMSETLSYIDIPLFIRYYLTDEAYINGGFQPAILVSESTTIERDGEELDPDDEFFPAPDYAGFDLGFVVGGGYTLPAGFDFGANFELGMIGIDEDFDEKRKNLAIKLSVGYIF